MPPNMPKTLFAKLRESTDYVPRPYSLHCLQNIRISKRRIKMNRFNLGATLSAALALAMPALLAAAPAPTPPNKRPEGDPEKSVSGGAFQPFKSESVTSNGNVTIGGQSIAYQAVAGTLIIHPKDWDDVPRDPKA